MTIRLNIRPTPPPTYLGWPRRTAVGLALALAAAGAAIGLALPTPTACTVVEDGPTGPEAGVTLGLMVIACPDGRYAVTYVIGDPADVIDVQRIPSAPCGWTTNGVDVMPAPCPAVNR